MDAITTEDPRKSMGNAAAMQDKLKRALALGLAMVNTLANAAPVLVTPGTNAGYMYFPAATATAAPSNNAIVVSLPIKAAGDACVAANAGTAPSQSATEGQAITADRSMLLTCQSGQWKSSATTVSLPVKAVGDPCVSATTGTAPNQSASEGTAITLARDSLLTCQSGQWEKQATSALRTPLYLESLAAPVACPAGWIQIAYFSVAAGQGSNNRRTCLPPDGSSCSVLYLETLAASPACPAGWIQAQYVALAAGIGWNNRRTCYRCDP